MKNVRYPVGIEDLEDEEERLSPDLLDVDELQRNHPAAFAKWVASDPSTWDGTDQAWLDRVVLAQAYADPDGEWRRTAEAIRATGATAIYPWQQIAADVESRNRGSLQLALDVIMDLRACARSAPTPSDCLDYIDTVAVVRLRALASVEDIDLTESDYRFLCPGCGDHVLNEEGGDDDMPLHCTSCYAFGVAWQKMVNAEAAQ